MKRIPYKWLALSVTSLGALLASMNSGTLIIALPTLLRELHTTLLSLIWILLAYNLTQTVLVLNVGRLSDMVGRKNLYVLGFAVFTLSSFLAGFGNSAEALIGFRILQGIGGGFMIANSSAIVTDAFPRTELGLAIGTNQMLIALGAILGPILGGWLTTLGWRWVFWFNVPLGVIGTVWAYLNLRDTGVSDKRDPVDVWGNLSYAAGLGLLMVGLSLGSIESWSSAVPYMAVGAVGLGIFFWLETRVPKPMLDLSMFKDLRFGLGNLVAFLNAVARQSLTFLFVFYFQGARGLDPVIAGVLLGPIALGLLIASPIAGRLADRRGSKELTWIGLLLTALGFAGFALTLGLRTPYLVIGALMVLTGVGSGLFNSPNSSAIMGSVAADRRGIASGVRTLLISVGGTLSIIYTLSVVSANLPKDVMFKVFSGLASSLPDATLEPFITGLRAACWTLAALSVIAVIVALLTPTEARRVAVTARAEASD